MKILMLSIDNRIFEKGSPVSDRMVEYGSMVEELHIIVYTKPGFTKIKIAPNVWVYPTNSSPLSYFVKAYYVGSQILKIADDFVITSQDAFTNVVAFGLGQKAGVKVEIQIHTDFLSPHYIMESFKNRLRSYLYLWAVNRADRVRVVSARIANSLVKRKIDQRKIMILPIFVDTESIRNGKPVFDLHDKYSKFNKIILMVSRFSREKNIPLALDAMSTVIKTNPQIGLVIVGDGQERDNIQNRINNLGLENNVILEDWSNNAFLQYKTADLFLNTSLYEGYGMTLIEAASAGLPIITTEVGIVGEIFVDGISCVVIKSKDDLVNKIILLSLDHDIKNDLVKNANNAISGLLTRDEYLNTQINNWSSLHK